MQGKGNMSVQGEAQNGDLLIKVKVRPHSSFQREGANVLSECRISVATAILGGKVKVQTL
jgi:molecular chaperone DnaJ